MILSKTWVISFVTIDSALKCLDCAKFDKFSLEVNVSKPMESYAPSGFLFQSETSLFLNMQLPKRPMPLVRVDPSELKIKSKYFGNSLIRKKQDIFFRKEPGFEKEISKDILKAKRYRFPDFFFL